MYTHKAKFFSYIFDFSKLILKYKNKFSSNFKQIKLQGLIPWVNLLISRLQNSCVPRSGTYFQYFSHNFRIIGPGISSNGNGVFSIRIRGVTLDIGILKLSIAVSEFAVSNNGIAFVDVTVAFSIGITRDCATEAAGLKKFEV